MKTQFKIKSFWGLIVAAIAVTAFNTSAAPIIEGGFNGGGGKGGACRDANGKLSKVILLDLWESEVNFQRPVPRTNEPLEVQVERAINVLSKSIVHIGSFTDVNGKTVKGSQALRRDLMETADRFIRTYRETLKISGWIWSRDARLEPTPDSFERLTPRSCPVEQIVRYEDDLNEVRIDRDLTDKMETTDLAALFVHEALYKYFREHGNEPNSLRVRRAVGLAFSGYKFTSPAVLQKVAGKKMNCIGGFTDTAVTIYSTQSQGCYAAGLTFLNSKPEIGASLTGDGSCPIKNYDKDAPAERYFSLEDLQKRAREVRDYPKSQTPLGDRIINYLTNNAYKEDPKKPKGFRQSFDIEPGSVGKFVGENGRILNLEVVIENSETAHNSSAIKGKVVDKKTQQIIADDLACEVSDAFPFND